MVEQLSSEEFGKQVSEFLISLGINEISFDLQFLSATIRGLKSPQKITFYLTSLEFVHPNPQVAPLPALDVSPSPDPSKTPAES